MPRIARHRTIPAPPGAVWDVIADPHHMPRWWPGVARMEGVDPGRFTQVFTTRRGRPVRADFRVAASESPHLRCWEQELPGTPFERVLHASIIEVRLEPAGGGTEVTIIQEQKLRGYSRTGGFLVRRAMRDKLDEALDGLERVVG